MEESRNDVPRKQPDGLDPASATPARQGARQSHLLAQMAEFAGEFLACWRFCTRLPIPVLSFESAPHRPPSRMLPLAGAAIGAMGAVFLALATSAGLPAPLPALLALTLQIGLTGALHEDGLADCADGFAGGATPQARLSIMKDSRLGTFGTLALVAGFALRAASLAVLAAQGLTLAATVLIATGAISRALALLPLWLLPAARPDGAGFAAAARPSWQTILFTGASAFGCALLPLAVGVSLAKILVALAAAGTGAAAVTWIARRVIGGQTGDVAGAAQQVAEICAYLAFAARP